MTTAIVSVFYPLKTTINTHQTHVPLFCWRWWSNTFEESKKYN